MIGLLFPGQGAQTPGMGAATREHPAGREIFATASEVLGYDLAELCADGPAEKLDQTRYAQPALFTVGIAAAEVLRATDPSRLTNVGAVAGLSLGEYTAVCFAGGLSFENALRLVNIRGDAMQDAADAVDSSMASVLGMPLDDLQSLCDSVRRDDEILQPANLLCPGNIAVSGHRSAIERLIPAATDAGAMKVVPLSVAGAFHTPIMQPAVARLTEALADMPIADTSMPVYSNVDAKPHTSAAEIRDLLARQVVSPVRWEDSVTAMIDDGVAKFEELGCGRVLRGTLKRINRKFPADGFGD